MKIIYNANLADYTTTRIGGQVKYLFLPSNKQELLESLKEVEAKKIPLYILGGGSNTLFADTELEFNQAVICLTEYKNFKVDSNSIVVGAGNTLQELVDCALVHNFLGLVELNRIPGTVGGACVGNAGAYGREINQLVKSVEIIDLDTFSFKKLINKECDFVYRGSVFKRINCIVLELELECEKASSNEDKLKIESEYQKIAEIRDALYPLGYRSPGSCFKNILFNSLSEDQKKLIPVNFIMFDKIPVGKLIEHTMGKGLVFGGIGTKKTHANILEVMGNGSLSG
jgi:UDP-N-acetylmuramate dehydrogenase